MLVRTLKQEAALSDADWEAMHACYDQPTYQAVLDQLHSEDVVLDIGAGDLRLARQMAVIARKVYAVEINARVLDQATASSDPLPANVIPIHADARTLEFPPGVNAGVLLMRHCTCFRLYAEKLQHVGATRLITNARWRMGVEVVNLPVPRPSFAEISIGWYACFCGGTGFKEGPAEDWLFDMDKIIDVSNCPQCMQRTSISMERL